ncbi:methyltransferase domain-containing protein [Streptomyces sp. XM4193]|uniref:methyltransferase domain-containing protein n=1 Tax=Streptomyces sp. XM4193 TaxID=2929782 RepID=UPI001FFC23F4|nr:methyltransferase domain-containing protein [Streptomyces sp. XM4193]MCK1798652.1 methyltransferase domain-containing protein [Streptomyces sp. XM4193]
MGRQALLDALVAAGALKDSAWREAFGAVPRETFVPEYLISTGSGGERRSRDDPDPAARARWREGAYEDVPLAIRLHEGELISSSSQPSLMAAMLEALRVSEGMNVLEIGTGSGWNAALLAHRLGQERVTTVDVEPEITEAARAHLAAASYRPTVVTGDGAVGHARNAPYDRVIATCALRRVPWPWVAQSAADGLILAPLATGLIALRVCPVGWAEGRFLETPAYFVPLRGADQLRRAPMRPAGVPAGARAQDSFRFLLTLSADVLDPREAYELWRREGEPGRERFGITVTESGQWVWLDSPDGPHRWALAAHPPHR